MWDLKMNLTQFPVKLQHLTPQENMLISHNALLK